MELREPGDVDCAYDYFNHDSTEVCRMKCPCLTCGKFQGEYEDTGNGLYIVHCADNQTRCVTYDAPCPMYDDAFEGVKDVN